MDPLKSAMRKRDEINSFVYVILIAKQLFTLKNLFYINI